MTQARSAQYVAPMSNAYNPNDVSAFYLEREAFQTWLANQAPDTIVGYIGHPFKQPVARFLTSKGYRNVVMAIAHYTYTDHAGATHKAMAPEWVEMFNRATYTIAPDGHHWQTPITVAQALIALALAA